MAINITPEIRIHFKGIGSLLAASVLSVLPLRSQSQPKQSEILLLGYHCSLDLPITPKKIKGAWIALSYSETLPIVGTQIQTNKETTAKLTPVNVIVEPCGGKEIGMAFPESPKPRIVGDDDVNVHWLIRGIWATDPPSLDIECASWLKSQTSRYGSTGEWRGIFANKPFSLKRTTTPSIGQLINSVLRFYYNGKSQLLIKDMQGDPNSFFVGDLDFDGRPDLIITTENDKGCGYNYLFLSSRSSGKQLVKCVKQFEECND